MVVWHTKRTMAPATNLTQGIRVWRVVFVLLAQIHRLGTGANRQRNLPLEKLWQTGSAGVENEPVSQFFERQECVSQGKKRLLESSFNK